MSDIRLEELDLHDYDLEIFHLDLVGKQLHIQANMYHVRNRRFL